MQSKYFHAILVGLMLILLIGAFFIDVPASQAQSNQVWSEPINLSNAGSSSNPTMVIDVEGTIHTIWIDEFDGYKYVKSTDGVEWSSPITVKFPFSPKVGSSARGGNSSSDTYAQPVFLVDRNGSMHVLWLDEDNTLFYSKDSTGSDLTTGWSSMSKLADSVLDFEAVVSSQGNVHIAYISILNTEEFPSGVYYLRLGSGRSNAINLYSSQYFRSLESGNANVHLAVSESNEFETVYITWDDRLKKQIFLSESLDGGNLWGSPVQINDSVSGSGTPYNINVGVADSKLLLLWQYGLLGSQCVQYSQWSIDGVDKFGSPEKMLDESAGCPQSSEFLKLNKNYSLIALNILDEITLLRWNGSDWSKPQIQSEVTTFINPANFESVILGCQKVSIFNEKLFMVGCDKGIGGDIWFSFRSLGTAQDWFPPSSAWTTPVEVAYDSHTISTPFSVTDDRNVHTIWVQPPSIVDIANKATIQYVGRNGDSWLSPVTIISNLTGNPVQLRAKSDHRKRLLLAWVDSDSGDILFSWAGTDRANLSSEWEPPHYVPSLSQANSSPDILIDGSGKILIVYAIPINEQRGIYFTTSEDGGVTWSQPSKVFDAALNGWEIIDQPIISLTGDGRLHLLFRRYSLQGDPRRLIGLYYSQSENGGVTWTDPELVSEMPEPWAEIVSYGYDQSILHRLWQEYRQSILVSFHQVSEDGGVTWTDPVIVSNLSPTSSPTGLVIDMAGNLHFLQLTAKNNLFNLNHQTWNGSSWVSQKPEELYLDDGGVPSFITASVTPQGQLNISILVDYPDDVSLEKRSAILHMEKYLKLPTGIEAPQLAMIATVEPVVAMTEEPSTILQQPTQSAQPAGSPVLPLSVSKNIVGLVLLVGLLALVGALFWAVSKKRDGSKKLHH